MSDRVKIRAMVQRLRRELGEQRDANLDELIAYIDSMPEETASEDLGHLVISLEETIGTSPHSREVIKEHLQKAAEWQKQQMMKNAVEGLVCGHNDNTPAWIDLSIKNKPNVNVGDKVKIIIVKENML